MNKETFLERIKEIGTCEDEIKRRELLSDISTEIEKIYDDNENLKTSNEKFTKDNETLRETNLKLFLRVGESKEKVEEPTFNEPPKEYKSYEEISSMFMK